MGKRKKSSRKAAPKRKREPLETAFTCLFCHHDKSVTVYLNRKEGIAQLVCKVCDQRYQGKVNHLTEPIDIYSEWIDAADAAQKDEDEEPANTPSRSTAPRARITTSIPSDDED